MCIRDSTGQTDPFFAYIAVSIPHSRYSGKRFREANPLSSPAGLLDRPPHVLPPRHQIRERILTAGMAEGACEGLWPVSYTHLDVYKRQIPSFLNILVFPGDCSFLTLFVSSFSLFPTCVSPPVILFYVFFYQL